MDEEAEPRPYPPPQFWTWSGASGERLAEVKVMPGFGAARGTAGLRNVFTHPERAPGLRDQILDLEATPCRFGGVRWWWRCPATRRRCAKLYLPMGGRLFLSRAAHGLAYASQSEDWIAQAHRRAARLHRRLGSDERRAGAPEPPKPKWMRWRTYGRLLAELEDVDEGFEGACLAGAARLLARRRE